jgi:hypothetical protein
MGQNLFGKFRKCKQIMSELIIIIRKLFIVKTEELT